MIFETLWQMQSSFVGLGVPRLRFSCWNQGRQRGKESMKLHESGDFHVLHRCTQHLECCGMNEQSEAGAAVCPSLLGSLLLVFSGH